ncbi:MAG: HAMP domain-containing protein, partial [Elusimicrobia bacterium]|nr:HAMP domain-containing protein [Elusimicrobiota bacterium]
MKLRTRFSLIFAGLVTLVLVLTGVFLYLSEKSHLERKVREEQWGALKKLASLCQEATLSKNEIILINHLALLRSDPKLAYAAFVDLDGRILVHTETARMGQKWDEDLAGNGVFLLRQSIQVRGTPAGEALLAYHTQTLRREIQSVLYQDMRRFVLVAGVALVIAILLGFYLAHSIARPIGSVALGAIEIGEGKLDYRIPMERSDEIGILAGSFNHMAKRLQELDELKEEFISMISHELRSPLSGIKGYTQILRQELATHEKYQEFLGIIEQCADRLARLVSNILDLAKMEAGLMEFEKQPLDMAQAGLEAVRLLMPEAEKAQIKLELNIPKLPPVSADTDAMK